MDFETYLLEQLHTHPSMEPRDVLKLCYQAAFGAEHLLADAEKARAYLEKEYEETALREMPLYEQISEDICRMNLAAWKYHGLPLEWLFQMFAASFGKKEGAEARFYDSLKRAEAVFQGNAAFSMEDWQIYLRGYMEKGLSPVHHSENYRKQEHPAYRIVNAGYIRLLPILEKAAAVLSEKETCVIAIDGRAASGKTTLAGRLQSVLGADVIEMDDFFLPPALRTAERLAEAGGNVHYERFREEVLPFLSRKEPFVYRVFSCSVMDFDGEAAIGTAPVRIVEGSYSQHPLFGDYADVKLFSTVDAEEQMARILKRNGEQMAEMFRTRWIPMEEAYFAAFGIAEKADIIMK